MSASTDRRVARLVGRIAEERAARGRPTVSHTPRIARTFSGRVIEPPEIQGDEAEMLHAHVDIATRWGTIDATREVRRVTRDTEFINLGPYSTVSYKYDSDTRDSRVSIGLLEVGMIDYMDVAQDDYFSVHKQVLGETRKPKEEDISIVDRVFAGWDSGVAR